MTINPYKSGFCDGLLGRECANEYGYNRNKRMDAYLQGFLDGMQARFDNNITMKLEREEA